MLVALEPVHVLYLAFLGLGLLGAGAGVGRWLLKQFEKRIDERLALLREDAREWRKLDRDLNGLRAHVSEHYVMREDYLRNQSVMEAKLDVLAVKLEQLQSTTWPRGGRNEH